MYCGPKARPTNLKEVTELLLKSKNMLIMTGAGISAGSGIPTFRGEGGFWNGSSMKEVLTLETFKE